MPINARLMRVLSSGAVLQVALDLLDLERAVRIAHEVLQASPNIIIEVGTPLIKSVGMEAVRRLRREFTDAAILADMKAADVGGLEVEMAASAGADAVTVLGAVGDEVVKEAVERARELGVAVQVDTIGVKDVASRARKVKEIGADIIGLHVGIDVQRRRGVTAASLAPSIRGIKSLGLLVSVAGGLTPETIPIVVEHGADIVVVGGYITRSSNPYEAAKRCVEALGARG